MASTLFKYFIYFTTDMKKKLYYSKILFYFLIFIFTIFVELNFSNNKKFIIVCESFIPFEFEQDGIVKGIDIDIIDKIFKDLNIKYKVDILPWARAWKMIEHGCADASLSTSRKSKRMPYVFYPKEDMWTSEYVFFCKKKFYNNKFNGYEFAQKNKLMIGIIRGNSYHDSFWQAFPNKKNGSLNEQLEEVKDVNLNFLKLLNERIDLYIIDKTIGLYTIKEMGISNEITYYKNILFSKGYPIAFSKKSKFSNINQLIKDFDKQIKIIKNNGTYDQIMDKWLN